MKKAGNIIFWIVIAVMAFIIIFKLYDRYKPEVDLKQVPWQETRKETTPGEADKSGGAGTDAQGDTAKGQDGKDQGDEEGKEVMAPDFTLEDIDGQKVKLSDYKGKIVFLNFWAVWCPYCVQEMPDLDAANTEFSKEDDAVILAVDVQEDAEKVEKFIQDKKLTLPVLMDYDGSVSGLYGVSAFPTTFVINKDGTVYGYHQGPLTKDQILNLVNRMNKETE